MLGGTYLDKDIAEEEMFLAAEVSRATGLVTNIRRIAKCPQPTGYCYTTPISTQAFDIPFQLSGLSMHYFGSKLLVYGGALDNYPSDSVFTYLPQKIDYQRCSSGYRPVIPPSTTSSDSSGSPAVTVIPPDAS